MKEVLVMGRKLAGGKGELAGDGFEDGECVVEMPVHTAGWMTHLLIDGEARFLNFGTSVEIGDGEWEFRPNGVQREDGIQCPSKPAVVAGQILRWNV